MVNNLMKFVLFFIYFYRFIIFYMQKSLDISRVFRFFSYGGGGNVLWLKRKNLRKLKTLLPLGGTEAYTG